MAIHREQVEEVSESFSKIIDEGARDLIFQNLQRFQYQYPIRSTVREAVSNGLDSIRERDIAKLILSGKAKVEDYYIQREGSVYEGSGFDAHYYDLQWLSDNPNVVVTYYDGGELGKDRVTITDNGVGLGGNRLRNSFNLGFSSKRLNRYSLGKFGLGLKSPLSTGIPCYQMTTWYNGREYSFDIYNHKFGSIVPRYDMDNGLVHGSESWRDGEGHVKDVFYRSTNRKNGVEISFAVKKHHKQQYIDAVTSQLLYFPQVKLFIVDSDGNKTEIPVRANILYEDDLIVMSSNAPYSKPHILLNGVNYGFIDFRELELDDKMGNIGIKVDPEKVSVNPSRESLIWDDITRAAIIEQFGKVVSVAEAKINEELKETDFLKWLTTCSAFSWNLADTDNIIGRLAKVVDMSKVRLAYPADPRYKYDHKLLHGLQARAVSIKEERAGSKTYRRVDYSPAWRTALGGSLPIYIQGEADTSNRKNKYLCSLHPQGFILIKLEKVPEPGVKVTPEDITQEARIEEATVNVKGIPDREGAKKKIADLHNFILASKSIVWYDKVEVPKEFTGNEEEEEEEVTGQSEEEKLSLEERRKLNGRTIMHTPRIRVQYDRLGNGFEMQKLEVPIHLIDSWSNPEIYWSNKDTEGLLFLAGLITRHSERDQLYLPNEAKWESQGYVGVFSHSDYERCEWFHDDRKIRLFRISQGTTKYYRDFKHITRFFKEIRKGVLTMSNSLVSWNTARLISKRLEELEFLNGFSQLDPVKSAQYDKLYAYVRNNYRSLGFRLEGITKEGEEERLTGYLDAVGEFQLFVRQFPDDEETIARMAREMFNPEEGVEIRDGRAIDLEIYDIYTKLLDWSEPVREMMNMISPLVNNDELTEAQEAEIRNYFKYRNCPV